jgi:hypothetical protein
MKLPRRRFLHQAAGAAAMPALSRITWAQTYPTRPVRIIVGFAAGGTNDILARLIGQWLSDKLGQPYLVEDRPGAGGNIATEAVVRARADGYTLHLASTPDTVNATLYDKLNNFIRDIAPVASIMHTPCRGGQSIGPCQNGCRAHCLRQGQSAQAQHGLGRHREPATRCRRDVQDDDRR